MKLCSKDRQIGLRSTSMEVKDDASHVVPPPSPYPPAPSP